MIIENGIIAILQTIDDCLNTTNIMNLTMIQKVGGTPHNDRHELLQWRLRILSLIEKVHEELLGQIYLNARDHIFMGAYQFGDKEYEDKFKLVHEMFAKGLFTIDIDEDNYRDSIDANSVSFSYTIEELKDMAEKEGIITTTTNQKEQQIGNEGDLKKKSSDKDTKMAPKINLETNTSKKKTKSIKNPNIPQKRPRRTLASQPKSPAKPRKKQNTTKRALRTGFLANLQKLECYELLAKGHPRGEKFKIVNHMIINVNANDSENQQRYLWEPEDIVGNIISFISHQYVDRKNQPDMKDFQKKIRSLMEDRSTYFIMDYNPKQAGEKSYHLVAAMVVDNDVTLMNGEKCTIVHAIGLSYNNVGEYKDYMKILFHYFIDFGKDRMIRKYYAITNPNEKSQIINENPRLSIMNQLSNLGFSEIDNNFVISEFIDGEKSKVMECRGQNLFKSKKAPDTNDTERRFSINNTNKVKFMYSTDNNKFMVYSHAFGWTIATDTEMEVVLKYTSRLRKNPNEHFTIGGAGARSSNSEHNKMKDATTTIIEERFQQATYDTKNSCVWLAASSLISDIDKETGEKMHQLFLSNPLKFERLPFQKLGKNEDRIEKVAGTITQDTLHQLLRMNTPYQLQNVKKDTSEENLNFLLREDNKGMFVCLLEDFNGNYDHCVAVNCSKRLVFDCMNDYVMNLTENGLAYCVGNDGGGLRRVKHCYEVVNRNQV